MQDKSKWKTIGCQTTPAFYAEVQAAAAALGYTNVSGLVREAVEVFLAENKPATQPAKE